MIKTFNKGTLREDETWGLVIETIHDGYDNQMLKESPFSSSLLDTNCVILMVIDIQTTFSILTRSARGSISWLHYNTPWVLNR